MTSFSLKIAYTDTNYILPTATKCLLRKKNWGLNKINFFFISFVRTSGDDNDCGKKERKKEFNVSRYGKDFFQSGSYNSSLLHFMKPNELLAGWLNHRMANVITQASDQQLEEGEREEEGKSYLDRASGKKIDFIARTSSLCSPAWFFLSCDVCCCF